MTACVSRLVPSSARGRGGARGGLGDLSRWIHARKNFIQKGQFFCITLPEQIVGADRDDEHGDSSRLCM